MTGIRRITAREQAIRDRNRAKWAAEDARAADLEWLVHDAITSLTEETDRGVLWAFKLGAEMGDESDDIPELAEELWDTIRGIREVDAPKSWAIMRKAEKLG